MAKPTKEQLDYILFGMEENCKYRIGWDLAQKVVTFIGYDFHRTLYKKDLSLSMLYYGPITNSFVANACLALITEDGIVIQNSILDGDYTIEKVG
jgi:hypothetical protein